MTTLALAFAKAGLSERDYNFMWATMVYLRAGGTVEEAHAIIKRIAELVEQAASLSSPPGHGHAAHTAIGQTATAARREFASSPPVVSEGERKARELAARTIFDTLKKNAQKPVTKRKFHDRQRQPASGGARPPMPVRDDD
jgi:hypothetical protein